MAEWSPKQFFFELLEAEKLFSAQSHREEKVDNQVHFIKHSQRQEKLGSFHTKV
jgi:hypothetical protein